MQKNLASRWLRAYRGLSATNKIVGVSRPRLRAARNARHYVNHTGRG